MTIFLTATRENPYGASGRQRTSPVRCDPGESRGPSAPDLADCWGRHAVGNTHHARPHFFRTWLVADIRPDRFDSVYPVCNSHHLLAAAQRPMTRFLGSSDARAEPIAGATIQVSDYLQGELKAKRKDFR